MDGSLSDLDDIIAAQFTTKAELDEQINRARAKIEFGKALRHARVEIGLSISEFAQRIGIIESELDLVERGWIELSGSAQQLLLRIIRGEEEPSEWLVAVSVLTPVPPGRLDSSNPPVTVHRRIIRRSAGLIEMAWDPITRLTGNLGVYAKIDFGRGRVVDCHSTSSAVRGYDIFMRGKDPRDAHFVTSRICGMCGSSQCLCSIATQNMAFGVVPPHLGEWLTNLGEAAEYMFDHTLSQENMVGVDFCEKMVGETNPGVLDLANRTPAPNAAVHGYAYVGDIMRALNPFSGEFYREALAVSRWTREMFCLMDGRHAHPSTAYPGGNGTTVTIQLLTDYYARLMRFAEFMKRVVPLHDDLFLFFYDAMPGYEEVGRRRILTGCWGSFQDPDVCDFNYRNMTEWGRAMFVTPGVVVDGKLVSNDLVDINLGIRVQVGHSFYDDWDDQEMFVTKEPLGNPVDRRHPWNHHSIMKPQKRDFDGKYSWLSAPRWFDGRDHLALDTGGGPLARLFSTALSGLVDIGYIKATGHSIEFHLPRTALKPEADFVWDVPKWSNAIERDRARSYFQLYACCCALHFMDKALGEVRAGHTKTWSPFTVPDEAIGCGFIDGVRGMLSHHMVVRSGKIANYTTCSHAMWNASPRDDYGTPGPYEDAVMNTPIFEENSIENFKGIDIIRAIRSYAPCMPCGTI